MLSGTIPHLAGRKELAYEVQSIRVTALHLLTLEFMSGYRNDDSSALFSQWYNLLKDKRQARLDFVKALVKALTVDPTMPCDQVKPFS